MRSGQALVEMLIAIAVVTVALVAMVSLSTKSLSNANFSQSQTTKLQTATQTIECIRNRKNTISWDIFYSNPIDTCGNATFVQSSVLPQKITVTATETWTDSKGTHNSVQTTEFVNY